MTSGSVVSDTPAVNAQVWSEWREERHLLSFCPRVNTRADELKKAKQSSLCTTNFQSTGSEERVRDAYRAPSSDPGQHVARLHFEVTDAAVENTMNRFIRCLTVFCGVGLAWVLLGNYVTGQMNPAVYRDPWAVYALALWGGTMALVAVFYPD